MDRRARGRQADRAVAARRRKQAAHTATKLNIGDGWATVVFANGEGYSLEALHENKEDAEAAAALGSRRAADRSAYDGAPYTVVFGVPLLAEKNYVRDQDYFATLRAARGGDPDARVVALWPSQEEAEASAAETADLPPAEVFVYIGGAARLELRAEEPVAEEPAAEESAAEKPAAPAGTGPPRAERRRAERAAKKKAAKAAKGR